jgi:ketosteroid isomerase-like protein
MNLLRIAACLWIAIAIASAQTEDREADKQALRALAVRYETAINQGSFADLQDSVAPEMSAVFMTGVEVRGLPEMQAYYDKIKAQLGSGGSYTVKLDPAATDFHGDIAIAHGSSAETVVLGNGKRIAYRSQWTAVLRKIGGKWSAARLHVSINPIENPFVTLRLRATKGICLAIGVVAGLLIAWVIARFLRRRRQVSA